ncbi:hypothetical protein GJ744_009306 [Endocarpon pusillum]|uniref:Uncharacterized protein n=1 Tax=Endocarpon pusillum TaxID=364733 RepID=A0A8H7A7H5_9EURO|nr:hypothetical protein GJ744_009306 [Endocarpon pusillum]
MVVVDPLFELRPEVFNWIQIRAIGRPIHQRGVILHEDYTRLPYSRQLVVENGEIRVGSVF